jgi:hypothetical protein
MVECIEDDALLRIVNGELHERRAANVAHRDGVVEENRARIPGLCVQPLDARLRHHEHLRLDGQVQRLQHRRQVSGALVERQMHRPVFDMAIQLGDEIVGRSRVVADGVMGQRAGQRAFGELCHRSRSRTDERGDDDRRRRGNSG